MKNCKIHGLLSFENIKITNKGYQKCLICFKNKIKPIKIKGNDTNLFCPQCKLYKSPDYFHKNSKQGQLCKLCYKTYRKSYYQKPHVKTKEYKQLMRRHYKKKYGISLDDYENLLKIQNNKCAICKQDNYKIDHRSNINQKLHVDHCHKTGKVRGLLCSRCNLVLGKMNDQILLFKNCIEYLNSNAGKGSYWLNEKFERENLPRFTWLFNF